jgi:hypothetical protein
MIALINQIYEIKRKTTEHEFDTVARNLERIFYELTKMGYRVEVPLHEKYSETNTAIEASLLNENATTIVKVLKPIIYKKEGDSYRLEQKGIVIVG